MSRPHVVAPSELAALRDLELLARTTVEGLRQGLHRSPFHGYSAEFSHYRHYQPGDDLKYVDWKAFARTDRLYSRQFQETTNLGALFVVDTSRSMAFPSTASRATQVPSKCALARATAAVLATLVIDQGDAAGLLALNEAQPSGAEFVPARSGRHHLRVLVAALARLKADNRRPLPVALGRAAALLRRRGMVVVLSDFYEEDDTLTELRRLSRMGHDVIAIQTLAQEELSLPRGGAAEFVDLESERSTIADAAAIGDAYQSAFTAFLARVQREITREGLDYLRLITSEPLEPALRRFLIARRGGD